MEDTLRIVVYVKKKNITYYSLIWKLYEGQNVQVKGNMTIFVFEKEEENGIRA